MGLTDDVTSGNIFGMRLIKSCENPLEWSLLALRKEPLPQSTARLWHSSHVLKRTLSSQRRREVEKPNFDGVRHSLCCTAQLEITKSTFRFYYTDSLGINFVYADCLCRFFLESLSQPIFSNVTFSLVHNAQHNGHKQAKRER